MNKVVLFCFVLVLSVSVHARNTVPPYFGRGGKAAAISRASAVASRYGGSELNRFQKDKLEAYFSGAASTLDTLRLLAVQVQFSDSLMGGQPGSRRPEKRDYVFFNNEFKHLRDYYLGASRGRFHVKWKLLPELYTLPNGMGYYGEDAHEGERVVELVQSVIDSIDDQVDLTRYQSVFVIHAGAGQETDALDDSRNQLWSSFYDLGDIQDAYPDSSVTGLATSDSLAGEPYFVDNFILAPANAGQDVGAIGSLGIWAFEVGSRIGLLPLSDSTPYGYPDSRGAGNFDLMSWGLYTALAFIPAFPCMFNRMLAGWVEPVLVEQEGTFRLKDVNSSEPGDTACLKIPINESEYFLVVNRVHDTNFDSLFTFVNLDTACLTPDNVDSLGGAEFDYFLTDATNPYIVKMDPNCTLGPRRYVNTGSGIYIWHIDERVILENMNSGFLPNDFVDHKGVDLEEADGIQDLDEAGGTITFGGFFDSYREGNNSRFAPDTKPSSRSNLGADTGIIIDGISKPATYMQCRIAFSLPFEEARARWTASGEGQPPTPVDLDGDGKTEILVLAKEGRIYAFNADGSEYFDGDGDPSTIAPYIEADGAEWIGAGAFGDIDGLGDTEIIAASRTGALYAWKGNGSQVADGDNDPSTYGVLYKGAPLAAPPMLADINGDGSAEIAIVEHFSDSLYVSFVNASGEKVKPADVRFTDMWPVKLQAQSAAPLAFGACSNAGLSSEGVVIAWVDTIRSVYGLSYVPVRDYPVPAVAGAAGLQNVGLISSNREQEGSGWNIEFGRNPLSWTDSLVVLPPAVGDLDADGFDEAVLVLPDGKLIICDYSPYQDTGGLGVVSSQLRSTRPSAPSLGDIDENGTLDIALWDSQYFYVYTFDGKSLSNWPQPISAYAGMDEPPVRPYVSPGSPLIGDINGDGGVEVVFAGTEGAAYALDKSGSLLEGFPRPAPSGIYGSAAVADLEGNGQLSLILAGYTPALQYRDAVSDSLITDDKMLLAVQSLPGSSANDVLFWSSSRNGGMRQGRAEPVFPVPVRPGLAQEGSFIIYPNPVVNPAVNVRVIINHTANISVEIYNLEGESALSLDFADVNPGNLADQVFDEKIDISRLSSGLYFVRLDIRASSGSTVMLKPLAIKR